MKIPQTYVCGISAFPNVRAAPIYLYLGED